MSQHPQTIEDAVVGSLTSPDLKDLSSDLAENLWDLVLDDGPLKDIPIVGYFVKAYRAGRDIRDHLFSKKVFRFLFKLGEIPLEERVEFAKTLEADPKLERQLRENLVLALDRLDDFEKTELLARAFSLYIKGSIDYSTFREFAAAIDRCFLADLDHFRVGDLSQKSVDITIAVRLFAAGLVEVDGVPAIRAPEVRNTYRPTPLGERFRTLLLTPVS